MNADLRARLDAAFDAVHHQDPDNTAWTDAVAECQSAVMAVLDLLETTC